MAGPVYEFGDFRLDCARFELSRDGRSLRLERKPLELLIHLAASEGRLVTRTEIAKCLWDQEVFVDTEHGINTAVRKIRTAVGDDSESPRFIQTVTGMGYRFIAPVSVIRAREPAVEVAPAAAENGSQAVPPTPERVPSKLWLAIPGAFVAAVLIFALSVGPHPLVAHLLHRDAEPVVRSLAVLPLDNLSGDPGQNYFADGMTDEVTTMLARDSTLRITSRTSVMHKGARRPLRDIAGALNVDGILEGSVSRSGDEVHMTLQLIRADTDTHLWANSYDRTVNCSTTLPDDAARDIAQYLHAAVAKPVARQYVNPAAHDAYLRGIYFWTVGRNDEAGECYRKAVEIQPDYALGWAGLSQYYTGGTFEGTLKGDDVLPQGKATALKAVQLDDGLAEAHNALAAAAFFSDWDGDHALQELARAEELNPSSFRNLHLRAIVLSALGRSNEAIAVQRRGTAADPIAHPGAMAEVLMWNRRFDEAIEDAKVRLPDFPYGRDLLMDLAMSYHWTGQDRESVEMLARLYADQATHQPNKGLMEAYSSGNYMGVVRWRLAQLELRAKSHYVAPTEFATLYGQLGNRERAIALLQQAVRERDPRILMIETDPSYDFVHPDLRYRAIVQQLGISPPH